MLAAGDRNRRENTMPHPVLQQPLAWLVAGCAMWGSAAQAIVSTSDGALLGGLGQSFLDGVAKLIITRTDGTFGCSGSLLAGGTHVLTAGHCLSGDSGSTSSNAIQVSFKGGSVTATGVAYFVHPQWDGSLLAGTDLAVIQLAGAVTNISGYSLYTSNPVDSATSVVLAGYGLTGNGSTGSVAGTFGTLHYGLNQYDGSGYRFGGQSVNGTYLYDFDNASPAFNKFGSFGLGSSEVLIAPGDSGGPGLVLAGDRWFVAGVHSFDSCSRNTCPVNSSFGEVAGDVSVFAQAAWLQSVAGPVPEPHSYAMLLLGLGLIAGISTRRSR